VNKQVLVYDGFQRCSYLPNRVARLPLYRQVGPMTPEYTDQRLAEGDRRVGRMLYRTQCPSCHACEPLRILVDEFVPTKSQRRVLSKCSGVRVEIGPPTVTAEKLAMYNRHKHGRDLVADDAVPMDAEGYAGWLCTSCTDTAEMAYYLGDRLIGVGIVDLGRTSASSVYFYFDPDPEIARLSPGVFSALQEIELCRRTGRKYLYMGLFVADCAHLNYKASYNPHERLVDGEWRRAG
jgi:leucyl-tRNA---protein transferase